MEAEKSLLVSIVMPTYNRALFIGKTIKCIQQQTYPHWELIIVDDGSDDFTENIIEEISDPRIRFIKAGRININGKIKNIGMQQALGSFIAFIDSDDLWAPEKLSQQIAALDQHPEASFSLTGGYNFYQENLPVDFFYKEDGQLTGDIFLLLFKSKIAAFTQTLLLKNECLQTIKGFSENKEFADVEFILQLAAHFKAVVLFQPLVYRRLHASNHSAANWERSYQEGITLYQSYQKKAVVPASVVREALFKIHIRFGEAYLKSKSRKKAVYQHLKAWTYQPFNIIPLKKVGKSVLHYFKLIS
jgi:glycosyltransferase involved in cell wall biosynthesis